MKKNFLFAMATLLLISCGNNSNSVNQPEGALGGEFSVSAVRKVRFSKGNLRYLPTLQKWQFADNQYDIVGVSNEKIADDYEGWIDLYGWATAGVVNGDTTANAFRVACYKPTSIESVPLSWGNGMYGPQGDVKASTPRYTYDITGEYYEYDWGHNAIKNGGDKMGLWRTLTADEWSYLLFSRPRAMQLVALGSVGGVNGLFIFPDGYDTGSSFQNLGQLEYGMGAEGDVEGFFNPNGGFCEYNSVSIDDWKSYEEQGVVFLPTSGVRFGKSVASLNVSGYYWTAEHSTIDNGETGKFNTAKCIRFDGIRVLLDKSEERSNGMAVRLVMDIAENNQ